MKVLNFAILFIFIFPTYLFSKEYPKRIWNNESRNIQCLYDDPRKRLMDCSLSISLPIDHPMLNSASILYSNINKNTWILYMEHTENFNDNMQVTIDDQKSFVLNSNVFRFTLNENQIERLSRAKKSVTLYINDDYNIKVEAKQFNRLTKLLNIIKKGYIAPPN
ncbi:hypothetical protein [Pleionea sediminis]|uniref:hypothetical protein n=1 Tax=Pleionea sediminis TaxID=2569479 RepID=UPI0013DE5A4E|nr:hypothetical protein [Pleionea sediminis]